MEDFLSVLEKRKSSLVPWFRLAKDQIRKNKEEDVFQELLRIIDRYEEERTVNHRKLQHRWFFRTRDGIKHRFEMRYVSLRESNLKVNSYIVNKYDHEKTANKK
jgi:hypothetical protein